jgi:hypothetical protein
MAGMPNDLAPLFDRIRTLAEEPAEGDPERLLVEMEHTLTDGYAHALALESESIRLERAIGEALAAGAETRGSRDELTMLAGRRRSIERDMRSLRLVLERLKRRVEGMRRPAREGSHEARPNRVNGGLDPVLDL